MKTPFTPQQVRFLRAIGDAALTVHPHGIGGNEYSVRGTFIRGRGLTATFISLRERGALEPRQTDSGKLVGFTVTREAKAQLEEQLQRPTCPFCNRQIRTEPPRIRKGDGAHRFFVTHKDFSRYSKCVGSNTVVQR